MTRRRVGNRRNAPETKTPETERGQPAPSFDDLSLTESVRLLLLGGALGNGAFGVVLFVVYLVHPSALPVHWHSPALWLAAFLAGVIVLNSILRRWWSERLPAWVYFMVRDKF